MSHTREHPADLAILPLFEFDLEKRALPFGLQASYPLDTECSFGKVLAVAQLLQRFRSRFAGDLHSILTFDPVARMSQMVSHFTIVGDQDQTLTVLVEAADGKVGSTVDKLLIYCFKYDPLAGKYVPYAWGIMRIGGMLTLLVMAMTLVFLWKRERSNKRRLGQNV